MKENNEKLTQSVNKMHDFKHVQPHTGHTINKYKKSLNSTIWTLIW